MSDTLERLRQMQRRQMLGQVSVTDRLIKQVYIRAAKNLGKLAEGAKDESLTKRWVEDYLKAVNGEIRRMNDEIKRVITRSAQRAAEIRTGSVEQYLQAATGAMWAELSDRFTDVLSHCRTDALKAMIDGKLYKDGRELSRRIWSATGRLEGQIEEILLQGVAQQQSTWQIARALEAYVNPKAACPVSWKNLYPDTPFEIKVDYNATRLARTAINHVFWQTGINAAKANPFCTAMHWELSNAHYERQVAAWGECECDTYAQHDEGLGRGNFKPENLPRPHPNCLCYQYEVLPTPEDAADRFRAWMDGAEDESLEKGFGEWIRETRTIDNSTEDGTIALEDSVIPRSLGARAMNYDILSPEGDRYYHYVEGERVTKQKVFAGYKTHTPLDEGVPEGLTEEYGGDIRKWQHVKGIGIIDDDGEHVAAEVHWFYEESVGQVKHMIKRWLE